MSTLQRSVASNSDVGSYLDGFMSTTTSVAATRGAGSEAGNISLAESDGVQAIREDHKDRERHAKEKRPAIGLKRRWKHTSTETREDFEEIHEDEEDQEDGVAEKIRREEDREEAEELDNEEVGLEDEEEEFDEVDPEEAAELAAYLRSGEDLQGRPPRSRLSTLLHE